MSTCPVRLSLSQQVHELLWHPMSHPQPESGKSVPYTQHLKRQSQDILTRQSRTLAYPVLTDTCSKAITVSTIAELPTPDHSLVVTIRDAQLAITSSHDRYLFTTLRYMNHLLKPLQQEGPAPAMDELPRLILVMTNTHRHWYQCHRLVSTTHNPNSSEVVQAH